MAHKAAVTPSRGLKSVLRVCRWWVAVIAGFALLFMLGLITELIVPDWTIDPRRIPTDNLTMSGYIYYVITYATWALLGGCLAASIASSATRLAAVAPGTIIFAMLVPDMWESDPYLDLPILAGLVIGTICAWLLVHRRRSRLDRDRIS